MRAVSRDGEYNGDRVPPFLYSLFALFLLIHAAASLLFPEYVWGAHHLRYVPVPWIVAWFVFLIFLLVPRGSELVASTGARFLDFLERRRKPGLAILFVVSSFLFFLFRTRSLFLGDGHLLTSVIQSSKDTGIGSAGYVSLLMHRGILAVLRVVHSGTGGDVPFILTSCLAGGAALILSHEIARELTGSRRSRGLFFATLAFAGGALLYFGYVEYYPIMQVSVLLYIYLAILCLRGRCSLLLPASAILLASAMHISALALAPSWVLLLRRGERNGWRRFLPYVPVLTAAIAGGWAIYHYTEKFYRGMDAFIPFFHIGDHSYTFFSLSHLSFVLNHSFLLIGGALLLPFLRSENTRTVDAGEEERKIRLFLHATAALALLFILFLDPKLGSRDWDLMSLPQYPFLLFLAYSVLAGGKIPGRRAVVLVVGAMILHTLPWVAVQTDKDRAVRMTLAMVSRDPHYSNPAARAPKAFGVLLSRGGYDKEAGILYGRAITMKEDPQNLYNMGTNLARRGEYEEAISFLQRVIEAEPGYEEAHVNLAMALRSAGRIAQAEETLRRLLFFSPDNCNARFHLGNMLAETNREREAVVELVRAVECDSLRTETWANLGVCRARIGDADGARNAFRQALRLDPGNAKLKEYLATLNHAEKDSGVK